MGYDAGMAVTFTDAQGNPVTVPDHQWDKVYSKNPDNRLPDPAPKRKTRKKATTDE